MKRIIAIFFFAVYLFSTTEAHQVFKLPVVFEHYQEHRNGDHALTFLNYLLEHYIHSSPSDPDYARDMQLPFKTSDAHLFAVTTAFVPLVTQYAFVVPSTYIEKQEHVDADQSLGSAYSATIWQPPKSC